MSNGETWFSNQIKREIEIEKFIIRSSSVVEELKTHLEGPHGKVKAECRQRQDLGHKSLLVTIDGGGGIGILWLWPDWSIQTKRLGF